MRLDCFERLKQLKWHLITIEPAVFLLEVGKGFESPTNHALLYRKVCLNNFPEDICDDLTNPNHTDYMDKTQSQTSQWQFYESLCYNIPALLVIGLIGSWSDRINKKIPLFLCPIASLGLALTYLINSLYMNAPVGYILIGNLIYGISGGFSTFLMASFSYISTKTADNNKRTGRISIAYAFMNLGRVISSFTSGVLLDNTGYIFVYSLVLTVYTLVVLYIAFILKDLKSNEKNEFSESFKDLKCSAKCSALFGFGHMKESFLVTFQRRAGNSRKCLLVVVMGVFMLFLSSSRGISYLYYRHYPLNWTQTIYGYYSGFSGLVHFSSNLLLLPFLKLRMGVSDQLLLVTGLFSDILGQFWTAMCRKTWMVFITPFITYAAVFNMSCIRGLVSSIVTPSEYGKIFAVVAFLEDISGLCASYLFSDFLYPLTVDVYAGFSFIISGCMMFIPFGMYLWLYIYCKRNPLQVHTKLEDETMIEGTEINDIIREIEVIDGQNNPRY